MTPKFFPTPRSRAWPGAIRRTLRAAAPLVAAAVAFSCTAYAPALDPDNDPPVTTLVTNMQQSSGSSQIEGARNEYPDAGPEHVLRLNRPREARREAAPQLVLRR